MPKTMRGRILLMGVLLTGMIFICYNALAGKDNPVIISDNALTFAVGDVNSDTYPDIVVGVNNSPQTHNIRLFLNNQNGTFSDASSSLTIISTPLESHRSVVPHLIKLQDINNDNLSDIIVLDHNKRSTDNVIFLNYGQGVFAESDTIIDKSFYSMPILSTTNHK